LSHLQDEILRAQEEIRCPPIWYKAAFKGEKGEIEAEALLNSGSDVIVLLQEHALKIQSKFAGTAVFELADGGVIRLKVYEI
jgi:hypothetical protein